MLRKSISVTSAHDDGRRRRWNRFAWQFRFKNHVIEIQNSEWRHYRTCYVAVPEALSPPHFPPPPGLSNEASRHREDRIPRLTRNKWRLACSRLKQPGGKHKNLFAVQRERKVIETENFSCFDFLSNSLSIHIPRQGLVENKTFVSPLFFSLHFYSSLRCLNHERRDDNFFN